MFKIKNIIIIFEKNYQFNSPKNLFIMKKITLFMMKISLALCFILFSSGTLKAQLSANIVDLQGLIPGLSDDLYPTDMLEFQGNLYIGLADAQGSYSTTMTELIRYNGSTAEIVDLGNYEVGSFAYFCIYDNDLYFRLDNGQLGKYDGTTCTEINLTQLDPLHVQDPAMPGHMCAYNGELYFKIGGKRELGNGNFEEGEPLAKYNATLNTLTVFDMDSINSNLEWDCEPNSLTVFNGLLYGQYDFQYLVAFDGDTTADIIPFADPDFTSGWKAFLCVYEGNLYMRTDDYGSAGFKTLGKYDGTNPVSIIDLNALNPGLGLDNYPGYMVVHNNVMYFKAETTPDGGGNSYQVLASYDGSSTVLIHDLSLLNNEIAYNLKPAAITSYQGTLYLRGKDAGNSFRLIKYQTSESVPINNWGILLVILLISTLLVLRLFIRK